MNNKLNSLVELVFDLHLNHGLTLYVAAKQVWHESGRKEGSSDFTQLIHKRLREINSGRENKVSVTRDVTSPPPPVRAHTLGLPSAATHGVINDHATRAQSLRNQLGASSVKAEDPLARAHKAHLDNTKVKSPRNETTSNEIPAATQVSVVGEWPDKHCDEERMSGQSGSSQKSLTDEDRINLRQNTNIALVLLIPHLNKARAKHTNDQFTDKIKDQLQILTNLEMDCPQVQADKVARDTIDLLNRVEEFDKQFTSGQSASSDTRQQEVSNNTAHRSSPGEQDPHKKPATVTKPNTSHEGNGRVSSSSNQDINKAGSESAITRLISHLRQADINFPNGQFTDEIRAMIHGLCSLTPECPQDVQELIAKDAEALLRRIAAHERLIFEKLSASRVKQVDVPKIVITKPQTNHSRDLEAKLQEAQALSQKCSPTAQLIMQDIAALVQKSLSEHETNPPEPTRKETCNTQPPCPEIGISQDPPRTASHTKQQPNPCMNRQQRFAEYENCFSEYQKCFSQNMKQFSDFQLQFSEYQMRYAENQPATIHLEKKDLQPAVSNTANVVNSVHHGSPMPQSSLSHDEKSDFLQSRVTYNSFVDSMPITSTPDNHQSKLPRSPMPHSSLSHHEQSDFLQSSVTSHSVVQSVPVTSPPYKKLKKLPCSPPVPQRASSQPKQKRVRFRSWASVISDGYKEFEHPTWEGAAQGVQAKKAKAAPSLKEILRTTARLIGRFTEYFPGRGNLKFAKHLQQQLEDAAEVGNITLVNKIVSDINKEIKLKVMMNLKGNTSSSSSPDTDSDGSSADSDGSSTDSDGSSADSDRDEHHVWLVTVPLRQHDRAHHRNPAMEKWQVVLGKAQERERSARNKHTKTVQPMWRKADVESRRVIPLRFKWELDFLQK